MAAVMAAPAPALAQQEMTRPQPGYVYYNKPGADLAAHQADMTACLTQASRMLQPVDTRLASAVGVFATGLIPAMIAGAIAGATHGMDISSGLITNVENCMVVRGWRVIGLEREEGKALSKLEPAALVERMTPWIGAERAHGAVLRTWNNDLIRPNIHIYDFAGRMEEPPLSMAVWAQTVSIGRKPDDGAVVTAKPTPHVRRLPKGMRFAAPLRPRGVKGPAEGNAIVVVRITGPNARRGQTLHFFRPGPDGVAPAWESDKRQSVFAATLTGGLVTGAGKPLDTTVAFEVPAGRWRLEAISEEGFNVALCLGAPSFDVKPGETVFAGTFDLGAKSIGPSLDTAPAKALLSNRPDLASAVRAAEWSNGDVFPCFGQWIYALEFQGAPFAPGYAWGGALPAAPPAP